MDVLTKSAGAGHEVTLRDEEIADVSLATFYVFNKERAKAFRAGERPLALARPVAKFACLGKQTESLSTPGNDTYSPQPRPIRPLHKSVRKRP